MSRHSAILLLVASHVLFNSPVVADGMSPGVLGSAASRILDQRDGTAYTDPDDSGGLMLTIAEGTFPAGLGEPLNLILSADSDKDVLVTSADNGGFLNYMLSTNLGEECLGQSLGSKQSANLGDGKGNVTQVELLRWNFGNPYLGTCRETFEGGLHLRYWIQNTTGAYFMAASMEKSAVENHDIPPNGYNLGRDYLVGNLTNHPIEPRTVSNQSYVEGTSTYNNYTYQTKVQWVSNLLRNSSDGINHYTTVSEDGYPAQDGLVAVMTVTITERPQGSAYATIARASPLLLACTALLACILTIM